MYMPVGFPMNIDRDDGIKIKINYFNVGSQIIGFEEIYGPW